LVLGRGLDARQVVIAGDSRVGSRSPRCSALRDRGRPRPAAGVCISPGSISVQCAEHASKAAVDQIVTQESVTLLAKAYVGRQDVKAR